MITKRVVITLVHVAKARVNLHGDFTQQSGIPAVFVYMLGVVQIAGLWTRSIFSWTGVHVLSSLVDFLL